MKEIHGDLNAKGLKLGLVVSRFNEFITKNLLSGAVDCWTRHGGEEKDLTIVWAPGAFEVPMVAKRLADHKTYDAIVCNRG